MVIDVLIAPAYVIIYTPPAPIFHPIQSMLLPLTYFLLYSIMMNRLTLRTQAG